MKVDGSLKSLLQGVSQQPPRDRLPGQCSAQFNMTSDPIEGLAKRPPTDLVAELGYNTKEVKAYYDITTKTGNKYICNVYSDDLQITDLAGNFKTVNIAPGTIGYLSNGDRDSFKFHTFENDTIISNTNVATALTADTKTYANMGSGSKPMALIQILGGAYGKTYSVTIPGIGQIASYQVPDGSASPNVYATRTNFIALWLKQSMTQASGTAYPTSGSAQGELLTFTNLLGNATNWQVDLVEDVILITRKVGAVFSISSSDGASNINLGAITNVVDGIDKLPRYAPHGYVVRVATETDPEEDVWYAYIIDGLTPANNGTGFGTLGYWQECAKPDIQYNINADSMPHAIQYDPGTDEFNYGTIDWKPRQVGTDISNPTPSFIGDPIEDIGTFQGRLVFVAGSNVIMSRTRRLTDFWFSSAAQLVDSDPIDMSSTAVEASQMLAIVPHNKDLVIFSRNGQFVVYGRSAITPDNAALVLSTSFIADLRVKPVPAGRNVFFTHMFGTFTNVREFYSQNNIDQNDTRPITPHVKKFISGSPRAMAAHPNDELLVIQTNSNTNFLYVYQYIWSDTEKIQSAWSQWSFQDPVQYMFFDADALYLVFKYTEGAANGYSFLHRMPLQVEDMVDLDWPVYLDGRFDVANVELTFAAPSSRIRYAKDLVIVQGENCPNPGSTVDIESVLYDYDEDLAIYTLKENMNGGYIYVGSDYELYYKPTMPFPKDGDGAVISNAKLIIAEFTLSLKKTFQLTGWTTSKWGDTPYITYTSRIIGDPDNLLGRPVIEDGTFQMPFYDEVNNAELVIYDKSPYPVSLLDIEHSSSYSKKGRRMSIGGSNQ